ncbi:MAG: hypothetical protein EBS69_10175, partial [Verrucomicrobia bacterium]|nr:hypothetical protein [Verrucomicrobiota bacterium]
MTAVYTLVDGANGELASNYSLVNDSLASTITAKDVTISVGSAANKVYDGTTSASVTVGSLTGLVSGEVLGTTGATGTFNSKDVSAATTVTAVYTLVNGANPAHLASNYNLLNPTETLSATITAKTLTISTTTPSTVTSKVYDGTTVAAVTVGTLDGLVSGEALGATGVV